MLLPLPSGPRDAIAELQTFIDPADLDEPAGGLEKLPHLTVLWRLRDEDRERVKKLVAQFGPLTATFGDVTFFPATETGGADVLKLDIDSKDAMRLNRLLRQLLPVYHVSPQVDYKPHVTVAYLKRGKGEKYVGEALFTGRTCHMRVLEFVDTKEQRSSIALEEISSPENKLSGGEVVVAKTSDPPKKRKPMLPDIFDEAVELPDGTMADLINVEKDEKSLTSNPNVWYICHIKPWKKGENPGKSPFSFDDNGMPNNATGVRSFRSKEEAQEYADENPDPYLFGPFRRMA